MRDLVIQRIKKKCGGVISTVKVGEREKCQVAPWPQRSVRVAGAAPLCRCTHDLPAEDMEHHRQQQPQQVQQPLPPQPQPQPQQPQQLQPQQQAEQRRGAVAPVQHQLQHQHQHHRPCAVIGPDRQPYGAQRLPDVNARHQMHQTHQTLQVIQPHQQHQLHQTHQLHQHQVYASSHVTKPHPYERYDVDYQHGAREVPYNVEYDYQRYQTVPGQIVHNQAKMPERVPYEYPGVAYPRPPLAARYEPYPQAKEKYVHYQFPYPNPYAFVDQRKRSKTQAEEIQYCQVPRHAQPFYPASKVQAPCGVIDVNQKYNPHIGSYHSRPKQYITPPYDVNAVNQKVVTDPTKIKMDYYNHYRPPPAYSNMHYPNENYHTNYNVAAGYDYSMRSPNVHYQNPAYYKPVEYRQGEKNYEVDISAHKYYNPKYAHGNPLARIPTEFSPNIISPAGSNASFDSMAANSYQNLQEDGGYINQCSTVSRQSTDHQKREFYGQSCSRAYQSASSLDTLSPKTNILDKSQQSATNESLNLRKYLEMWDEEFEEPKAAEVNSGEVISSCLQTKSETEKVFVPELHVLDKIVISEEEVKKYEHVQKVTKLPDYIKDINAVNSKKINGNIQKDPNFSFPTKPLIRKDTPTVFNSYQCDTMKAPQPELFSSEFEDVEAKISQSVIHKEVRCNFEIKPLVSNQMMIPPNTLPAVDNKMKPVNPTNVPYNHVQMPYKIEKSANVNKPGRKVVQPEVLNKNYVNQQHLMHDKKFYPNITNPNVNTSYKNMTTNYGSLPIINVDESPVEIPVHHKKQEMHFAKPNPAYEDSKIPPQYVGNAHGKVNVIMNSAYADYKNPSAKQGPTVLNSGQPTFKSPHAAEFKYISVNPQQPPNYVPFDSKSPHAAEYKNTSANPQQPPNCRPFDPKSPHAAEYKNASANPQQPPNYRVFDSKSPHATEYKNTSANPQQPPNYRSFDSFNMNYVNKVPSQNNYFNISINSEKTNPQYHKYAEHNPIKPERIIDNKYVKPHEEKNVNKTTNINIALMLNENKKNDSDTANNRTVICRNDSSSFKKNNPENYEQYLDSESGIMYSSRNASITIQIEKRDELEYADLPVSKEPILKSVDPNQFVIENTYSFPQNLHLEKSSQNNHNFQSNNNDKSYELKIYETTSEDFRNDKQSIIVHSSCQQNNGMFLPQGYATENSDPLDCKKYSTKQNIAPRTGKELHLESNVHSNLADCQYSGLVEQNPEKSTSKPSVIDMSLKSNKNSSVIVKSNEVTFENPNTVINSVITHESSLSSVNSNPVDDRPVLDKLPSVESSKSINNSNIDTMDSKIIEPSVDHTDAVEIPTEPSLKSVPVILEDDNETQNSDSSTTTTTDSSSSSETIINQESVKEIIPENLVSSEDKNKDLPIDYSGLLEDLSLSRDSSSNSQSDSSDSQSESSETPSDCKEDEEPPKESEPSLIPNESELPIDQENELDCSRIDKIESESDSKKEISEESEPLIDFQDSLTNNFTKDTEPYCNPLSNTNVDTKNESIDEDKFSPTSEKHSEENLNFDEFQMVYELNYINKDEDSLNNSQFTEEICESSNTTNILPKHDLSDDDNDGISFKSTDCGVMLEAVSIDDHETYISFESDKAGFFCGDSDDDARYVIIRTDEQLSYAAAIDSENDLSSDVQMTRVPMDDAEILREEVEMSLCETREKLNITDGNEIEIGGYWIDDIACVETVAAEETVEAEETVITEETNDYEESPPSNETFVPEESFNDSTESCKSPSVAWSEHSSNDESNSATVYDDDSRSELLKDSNSNFITSHKDCAVSSEDVAELNKYSSDEQISKECNSNDPYDDEIAEKSKNSILKIKFDSKSRYRSKIIERNSYDREKIPKKRHYESSKSKSTSTSAKRKKFSSSDSLKRDIPKKDKLLNSKNRSSSRESIDKNSKYQSSSDCKSNKTRSHSNDEKTETSSRSHSRNRMTLPKKLPKPKPKFEDVLMNLNEANMSIIKMKLKKNKKKSIPKMIIKRNEEGSHYTSTPHKSNKTLGKSKWQPKVYLRRHTSIENMVKTK